MTGAAVLSLALLLDAVAGEPRWLWDRLPHPVTVMGRTVAWGDRRFNSGPAKRLKGIGLMAGLALAAICLGLVLGWMGWLVELAVVAILMAHRSLVDHVRAVADALRISLGDGRHAVSRIVGRDTSEMDRPAIARAAIESAAENFSDGVIAPAFWFLVAGLPGLLLYKITNTADSMIGHRNARYAAFGWAAARFDDLLNLIPARIAALLLAAVLGQLGAWRAITADARAHRSPNAGWPEAAMARGIDVALAGPRIYDGRLHDLAYINTGGRRRIGPAEIEAACAALWKGWGAAVALAVGLAAIV